MGPNMISVVGVPHHNSDNPLVCSSSSGSTERPELAANGARKCLAEVGLHHKFAGTGPRWDRYSRREATMVKEIAFGGVCHSWGRNGGALQYGVQVD